MQIKGIFYFITILLAVSSCSSVKYVDDGSLLLNKVEVKVVGNYDDINVGQLKSYVRQKGNSRWFSSVKIPLATYSLSGRDTSRWVNRMLRSIGEAPVLFDSIGAQRSCEDLRLALRNMGYMDAQVEMTPRMRGPKKMDAVYLLYPGEPYYVRHFNYDIRDSIVAQIIADNTKGKTFIQDGMRFNVNSLNDERKRITDLLTDRGYHKFHKDYITFRADSSIGNKTFDLSLILHQYVAGRDSLSLHPRYIVNSISYSSGNPSDSLIHLRRSVLAANTAIKDGDYFSSSALRKTYNQFGRLQAVKYTNISFAENENSRLLDCNIQLITNKPHSISFEPEGTNTAGDLGAAFAITYQNRNLFKGSEVFNLQLRGAYEAIRGLEGYKNQDFIEYSVESSLSFPRIIAPKFLTNIIGNRYDARSEVSVMYDLQNRPEYHRRVLSMAWKYKWSNEGHHDRYQIDLLDINYLFMPWISDTFRKDYLEDDTNRNAILRYNYENLLIMKWGVGYNYNNGRYAIKANVETSGNLLNLCSGLLNFEKNEQGQYQVFGIAYAQYAKADFDFTNNISFDYNNQLIFHVGFGIAYPYGNSTILPFEKRYFSGGANSVRGWSVRELGPGKFKGTDGNIDFINQTGDMKLDLNVEYRAHLFWKMNGALFVDAGNIWTIRNYEDQPGGQFKFSEFWKQIAVGYGIGFRMNFDYFILRFDLGMKAVNPSYEIDGGEQFPLVKPKFSRDFTFHFAVGLPF
ncbi:MAG: BamA/TamA family outer membrane protein [Prevotella sp.]|nr:BamA/TamA family outer membrane protein [Prevotella sp.]